MDNLTDGEPFDRIENVIDPSELEAISDRYKNITQYSLESMEQLPWAVETHFNNSKDSEKWKGRSIQGNSLPDQNGL